MIFLSQMLNTELNTYAIISESKEHTILLRDINYFNSSLIDSEIFLIKGFFSVTYFG